MKITCSKWYRKEKGKKKKKGCLSFYNIQLNYCQKKILKPSNWNNWSERGFFHTISRGRFSYINFVWDHKTAFKRLLGHPLLCSVPGWTDGIIILLWYESLGCHSIRLLSVPVLLSCPCLMLFSVRGTHPLNDLFLLLLSHTIAGYFRTWCRVYLFKKMPG